MAKDKSKVKEVVKTEIKEEISKPVKDERISIVAFLTRSQVRSHEWEARKTFALGKNVEKATFEEWTKLFKNY